MITHALEAEGARVGDCIAVRYAGARARIWHERLVHVADAALPNVIGILTPDGDAYYVDFSAAEAIAEWVTLAGGAAGGLVGRRAGDRVVGGAAGRRVGDRVVVGTLGAWVIVHGVPLPRIHLHPARHMFTDPEVGYRSGQKA